LHPAGIFATLKLDAPLFHSGMEDMAHDLNMGRRLRSSPVHAARRLRAGASRLLSVFS